MKVNLIDVLTSHSVAAYGYRTFSPFVSQSSLNMLTKIKIYQCIRIKIAINKIRNDKQNLRLHGLLRQRGAPKNT